MKKLSSLKLSSIVFGIFMLLPMFSILSRVIYIQSNPNAKESYYGETINEYHTTLLNNINNFDDNLKYRFNSGSYNIKDTVSPKGAYAYYISVADVNIITTNIQYLPSEITNFSLYIDGNSILNIRFNNNNTYLFSLTTNNIVFDFDYITDNLNYNFAYNDLFYTIEYNDYSYLDNVFDYSLHTFLEDDNNYSINFFNFFGDTFLSQSGNNMLYLNFLNWYMNYGLLVSCGYILFFILYFFINVIRKLVLSFTNKIDGGF